MIDRYVYVPIRKIENPALRGLADGLAHLVLENWFFILFAILLYVLVRIAASAHAAFHCPCDARR